MRFQGKRAFATGAASAVGAEAVELLVAEGARVVGAGSAAAEPPDADCADHGLVERMNGALGGFMPPSHVAEAVAYLASDAAASVAGSAFVVDRGTRW